MKKVSSWHIGVAGEAFAAAQFARYGIDVSVQYGANQPEYDLIATRGDKMLKVSVKGSQDGGWGLTQNYKKGCDYHEAIDKWLAAHGKKTIFCLVQFQNVADDQLPRMYLATPAEMRLYCAKTMFGESAPAQQERLTSYPKNGFSRKNEQGRCLIHTHKTCLMAKYILNNVKCWTEA